MILLHLLDHDLHKSRDRSRVPLWLETPARREFLPCLISSSRAGRFLTNRHLTPDGRIKSGIFDHDSDRMDDLLRSLVSAAYDLSIHESWPNVHASPSAAFEYVRAQSGMKTQPHMLLVPEKWTNKRISEWSDGEVHYPSLSKGPGTPGSVPVFRDGCRVQPCKVDIPVFCSRPDFVGLYTQFVGGKASIILHNVRNGLGFCEHRSSEPRKSRA